MCGVWQPDGAHLQDYGRLLKDGDLRVRKATEKKDRNLYASLSLYFISRLEVL